MKMSLIKRALKVLFTATLLFTLALSAYGCGLSTNTSSITSTGTVSSTSTAASETQSKTDEVKTYKIGDVVELDSIKVSLLSGKQYANIKGDNYTDEPESGNVYIVFAVEFENTGTEDKMITSGDFNFFADGYAFESKIVFNDPPEGKSLSYGTITTGKKLAGTIVYEVKSTWSELELVYDDNMFSDNNTTIKYVFKPADIAK